jgi:hypothetical protein
VLNPAAFIVNAFHKDYMKVHEPTFMKDFRTHEANREVAKEENKKVKKTPLKTVTRSLTIKVKPKTEVKIDLAKKKELILKPKDFKYFSAAGANNVTPRGKK